MTLKEIRQDFPIVTHILGDNWLTKKRHWATRYIPPRIVWYRQLESDLRLLEPKVGLQKLIACFRAPLRNKDEIQKTIFEVHGSAFLATAADHISLHVPRGDGTKKNFDVQAEIKGSIVNADSKTRKDQFPFNVSSGAPGDCGGRRLRSRRAAGARA